MRIVFPVFLVALAFSVFIGRMEAAKTPSPAPTPAQVAPPVPPPQLALHNQLIATFSQAARAWVAEEAAKAAKNTKITESNIRADIQTRFTGQSLTEADKNILLFAVLTEAAGTMADDLNEMFSGLIKKHSKNETPVVGANGTPTYTLSPDETMLLQAGMQRRAGFLTTMSNLMKKVPGTQGTVVGNLQ